MQVAPFSWLTAHDVEEGREAVNFSQWGGVGMRPSDDDIGEGGEADELVEVVQDGSMPPSLYTFIYPKAKLDANEKATLMDGLRTLR
jgi:hypothetical protein